MPAANFIHGLIARCIRFAYTQLTQLQSQNPRRAHPSDGASITSHRDRRVVRSTELRAHHETELLGFKQAPLTGALCKRAIGADDSVPRHLMRIGKAQYMACKTRRVGRNVAVGADKPWGYRPHSTQNRSATISACLLCHLSNGATVPEPVETLCCLGRAG